LTLYGNLRQNFFVSGKSFGFVLAEDQFALDDNIEDTTLSFDHLRFDPGFFFDRFRQTDGCWGIVSLYAIGDRNLHDGSFDFLIMFCPRFDSPT